jgi:hypothetical protein
LTPFQTHCYSENLAWPGIEAETSGLEARNSDHQTTEAVIEDKTLKNKHNEENCALQ